MLTPQRIITTYRRKRLILSLSLALLTLLTISLIRYVMLFRQHESDAARFVTRAVTTMELLLNPLEEGRQPLIPLVGQPCEAIQPPLRQQAARLQTVRSVALVKDGILYCSSIFGERHIAVNLLQPRLPASQPLIFLSRDNSLLKGTPILVAWTPTGHNGKDGIVQAVNIDFLSWLTLDPDPSRVSDMVLNVGDSHLLYGKGLVSRLPEGRGLKQYQQASPHYPFSITLIAPSPSRQALQQLPTQLPLALIISLLIGGLAWLSTAGRMSFSREINQGLAAREFIVFCQPLVSATTQRCNGVELLLRWENPRLGSISPDMFIPLAEKENLIIPLTRFVLKEVARQSHYFPATPHFHIGLNVAASHFQHGVIIEDVKQLWLATSPVQSLVLELTERDALTEMDYRIVREIHRLGIKLAIDDFGTGQSSLAYLEKLHPDVLKIDKSFTAAIGTDAVNSTVTSVIISLAKRLHIELVAEGVETEKQASWLRRQGVAMLQGYLYARPMPLQHFPGWLAANAASQPGMDSASRRRHTEPEF